MTRRSLRTGYTTGACSAAAAKAAALALVTQSSVSTVEINLPMGRMATFSLARCTFDAARATCCVIKDAGDDPDVTHGAEICAEVSIAEQPGLWIEGGVGVGIVTKPGLGLEIGAPAINPVPRAMIEASVREVAANLVEERGLRVVISVPEGERIARRTLNARLGVIGGISILGTTGIVVPYSTSAYKASVTQAIQVASATGCQHIVLTTGRRTEKFAQTLLTLPEEAFVQMGDFVGHALSVCASKGIERVTICAMVGKLSKIASGKFQTHASRSSLDMKVLEDVALRCGMQGSEVLSIRQANTARHVMEIAQQAGSECFFGEVCREAARRCIEYTGGELAVETIMVGFDGAVLGRAAGAS